MLLSGQGVAVADATEWQSASIPDMVSDFDSRLAVARAGTDVTTWDAGRGLAYQFVTASASSPQYAAAGWVGTRRTVQGLDFSSDRMTCTNTVGGIPLAQRLLGGTDQPGTILLVHQMAGIGVGAENDYLSFTKVGLTSSKQCFAFAVRDSVDNIYRNRHRDDALVNKLVDGAIAGGTLDTAKHVMAWAVSGAGQTLEQRLDDVVVASGDWDMGATTVDQVELGAVYGTSDLINAQLVRLIFYSRCLTSTELTAAYAGLSRFYL
jgi:hypothetical protein